LRSDGPGFRSTALGRRSDSEWAAGCGAASGLARFSLLAVGRGASVTLGLADAQADSFLWTMASPDSFATVLPLARGDETALVVACEEAPGLAIPASFGWKGF
jgi:hypothetical protein